MDRRGFLHAGLAGAAVLGAAAPSAKASETASEGLNLRDFGARGNGRQDDTAALRKALTAARNQKRPLFVPPGTYLARGDQLVLEGGGLLEGVPGQSRLRLKNGGRLLGLEGARGWVVRGLVFDGADKSSDSDGLVEVLQCQDVRFHDCSFEGTPKNGLHCWESQDIRVEGCKVEDVGDYGLFFLGCRDLQIVGNRVSDCGNNGIAVHRTEPGVVDALIAHNRVTDIHSQFGDGQNGNGINAYNADRVTISHNRMENCRYSAVRVNSCRDPLISGNQCFKCDEVAIFVEFAHSGAVVSDNLIDYAVQGISVTNLDEGGRLAIVSNNMVRNVFKHPDSSNPNPGYSYGISVEADTLVQGNLVEMGRDSDEPNFGILVGWGPYLRDVMVSHNQVRDADWGISVTLVAGAGRVKIADNMIINARRKALCGNRWEEKLGLPILNQKGRSRYPRIRVADNWIV